ncbi:regulator of chromosome condensation-like isoform X2 [Varroa jacobsoni]|uniref:RCC1-like domain-containing protein n=1 Tax=Varroa destructor TaxID=109461 RepID=A0A7M7K251_VARDE|nr:regulator of chromosome condensation-like [Varroa destructor]XP_022709629.1 regulator of chromosome condensation-like isoform X2 [Varroa jacobsoni]
MPLRKPKATAIENGTNASAETAMELGGSNGKLTPKQNSLNNNHNASSKTEDEYHSDKELAPPKRPRGRPRKKVNFGNKTASDIVNGSVTTEHEPKRKTARKIKVVAIPNLEVPQVMGEGKCLAAGDGDAGQLGIGEDGLGGKPRFVPVFALEGENEIQPKAVRCAAGGMHSLVLTHKGEVYSFGCNDDYALGRVTAEEEDSYIPGRVSVPNEIKVAKIAAGNVHNVILTTDGRVLIWGIYRDAGGRFGMGPKNDKGEPYHAPTEITDLLPERIVDIACGQEHTLLLGNEGNVFSMGCAEQGQLGRVRKSHCNAQDNRRGRATMLQPGQVIVVNGRKSFKCDGIWASSYNSFVRSAVDGTIWGCGLQNYKQLGQVELAAGEQCVFSMVKLKAFDPKIKWIEIVGGERHTLALDANGKVYAMGSSLYGRLGLGKVSGKEPPDVAVLTIVPGLEGIAMISAGDHTSFALDKKGILYSWGQGSNMLGQGDRDNADEKDIFEPTPCSSKTLKTSKVVFISAGSIHSLCIVTPKEDNAHN